MVSLKTLFLSLLLLVSGPGAMGWASASTAVALKDYSAAAAGLFNNMRTPAALIAGSMIPLGLLGSMPVVSTDDKRMRVLKRANILIAVASVLSEILAITYSTIAINKLAEIQYPATKSVAALIASYHELAWIGTNIHFLFGMFGFGLLVGNRAFVNFGAKVGKVAACWGIAAFLQCMSIVNNGIALGSDEFENITVTFASNLLTLSLRYVSLVLQNARGILSIGSLGVFAFSFVLVGKYILKPDVTDVKKTP